MEANRFIVGFTAMPLREDVAIAVEEDGTLKVCIRNIVPVLSLVPHMCLESTTSAFFHVMDHSLVAGATSPNRTRTDSAASNDSGGSVEFLFQVPAPGAAPGSSSSSSGSVELLRVVPPATLYTQAVNLDFNSSSADGSSDGGDALNDQESLRANVRTLTANLNITSSSADGSSDGGDALNDQESLLANVRTLTANLDLSSTSADGSSDDGVEAVSMLPATLPATTTTLVGTGTSARRSSRIRTRIRD